MSDRITYDPTAIREVGEAVCPDIANFYHDISGKAAAAGHLRDSAFGEHQLAATWDSLFKLFYNVVYETGSNTRAMGPTLIQISEDQEILEGDLKTTFGRLESEIDTSGHTMTPSSSYGAAPLPAPTPSELDENPYANQLGGPIAQP